MNASQLLESAQEAARDLEIHPWRALMLTLLTHLRQRALPAEIHSSLTLAEAYWRADGGSEKELLRAKQLTWEYLHSFPPGQDPATPGGLLARAVLCVLEPDGDDEDMSMTADWFAVMIDEAPPSSVWP